MSQIFLSTLPSLTRMPKLFKSEIEERKNLLTFMKRKVHVCQKKKKKIEKCIMKNSQKGGNNSFPHVYWQKSPHYKIFLKFKLNNNKKIDVYIF